MGAGVRARPLGAILVVSLLQAVVHAVPLSAFVSWGPSAGDVPLWRNDDGSSELLNIPNGVAFPFFGVDRMSLFVNTNGLITFGGSVSTFTPIAFPVSNQPAIAIFWGDVDTRHFATLDEPLLENLIWYSFRSDVSTKAQVLALLAPTLGATPFDPNVIFVATWYKVGYYNAKVDKRNTFQAVLASDGTRSFVIYQYLDGGIQWTTGDASGGSNGLGGTPAQVGFDAGDGEQFFSIPESRTDSIILVNQLSNVFVPGRFIFAVEGAIDDAETCFKMPVYRTKVIPMTLPGGEQLDNTGLPIAARRDCFVQEGSNIAGGWKVVYDGEDMCCSLRGVLEDGECRTACDLSVPFAVDFFYPPGAVAGDFGYLNCYAGLDDSDCLDLPVATAPLPLVGRFFANQNANPPTPRRSAVDNGNVREGAFVINIGTESVPQYAYCTGRGEYREEDGVDGACRMNRCGEFTSNFVIVGNPPAQQLQWCYFSCFAL